MNRAHTRRQFLRLLAGPPLLTAGVSDAWAAKAILIERLIGEARALPNVWERIDFISRKLLGIRYQADTLIGGPNHPEKFVVRDDAFDCVTFCEVVLAAAIARDMGEFETSLRRIRYDHGKVQYDQRNHYFADWCKRNIENGICQPVAIEPSVTIDKTLTWHQEFGQHRVSIAPATAAGGSRVLRLVQINGGLENGGTMTVMNTTLFHNTANAGRGGGIYNGGTAQVSNSTLADNSAPTAFGAGIFSAVGTLGIKGTIIKQGTTGENCNPAATASSSGYNLSDDSSCTFLTGTGDQNSGTAGLTAGGPVDNGGPTPTIALTSSSTALDAIPAADCTTVEGYLLTADQRGVSRPQGAGCDIGAFEARSVAAPMVTANVCPAGHTTPAPCSQDVSVYVPIGTTFGPTPAQVVTQGAPGLDFKLASSSCSSAAAVCVVGLEFRPSAPGVRMGAVRIFDASAHLLGSTLIYGLGQGPAIAFGPGVQTTVGDGFLGPHGVAVDAQGNVFATDPAVGKFLEFRIVRDPAVADQSQVPATLIPNPDLSAVPVARQRTFVFGDGANQTTRDPVTSFRGPWGIGTNGGEVLDADYGRISAAPRFGTRETWTLVNGGGGWDHPIHIHFEEGQVLARNGSANAVPAWEKGRKDVYRLRPDGSVTITMQFRDWGGMFMEHCHNTVHEDNAMLMRWEIDNNGAPFVRPLPTPISTPQGCTFVPPDDILPTAF